MTMHLNLSNLTCALLAALAVLSASRLPGVEATNTAPAGSFDSFALIGERNIFDPNRRSRAEARTPREERTDEPESASVEFFTLLGTLSYEKGTYAFFNGSDERFRKTVQPEQRIGDYQVVAILPAEVCLSQEGGEMVTMKVGMQLKRENEGAWELRADTGESGSRYRSRSSRDRSESRSNDRGSVRGGLSGGSSTSRTEQASSSPPAPEDDDILKRLLRKREEELGNEEP